MSEDFKTPNSIASLPVVPPANQKVEQLKREISEDLAASAKPAAESPAAPASNPAKSIQQKLVEGKVIEVLQTVYDPEIPVNIYELGLIYGIDVDADFNVKVTMTLTTPACPVAGSLPGEIEKKVEAIPEVKSADINLVWDPPWSRDRMSEAALLQLGLM